MVAFMSTVLIEVWLTCTPSCFISRLRNSKPFCPVSAV